MARARTTKSTTTSPRGREQTEGLSQFEEWLPEAQRWDGPVRTFNLDPVTAAQNVRDGVSAVLAHRERLRRELPTLDLARLARLPDLALATIYASTRAERASDAPRGIRKQMGRAYELRELMLTSAHSLALGGFLSKVAVSKIREGRGSIDLAKDCVDLAGLFQKNAAVVKGRSPVAREHVKEAAEVGSTLLAVLQPKGTRKRRVEGEAAQAADDRDRLGALLVRDYDLVRRAAYWLFGAEGDQRVPPLGSRPMVRKRAGASPEKPATPTA